MQGQDSSHGFKRLFRRQQDVPAAVEGVRSDTVIEHESASRPVSEHAQPGDRIAGYLLEAPIGQGGQGVVYRAYHLHLGRAVALKLLPPTLAEDERFRTRFVRESRMAASLLHPNIVTIFDAGEAHGRLYIAMQFVSGGDLGGLLEREGPLEPGRAVRFLEQIGAALDTAHQADLVHRDVKPANMLVDGERALLTDFGLTKRLAGDRSLTGGGQIVGTLDYLAPEQIERRPLDGRADVYALGAVAYDLIAGEAPFADYDELGVLDAHLRKQPPALAGTRDGLTGELDEVIARAMAKLPDDRYSTCAEFVHDLREAVGGTAAAPPEPGPPSFEARVPVVLLAGHDAPSTAGMRSTLVGGRYRVAEAEDADAAVAEAHEVPPDLVVMDWNAGAAGLCAAIRDAAPDARVLAVVNRADSSDRRALLDQGADEVLTRPVSPIRLLATARMLVGGEVTAR